MWAKSSPNVELLDSLETYLPLILLSFNEEEYMNQPVEEGGDEDTMDKGNELGGQPLDQ